MMNFENVKSNNELDLFNDVNVGQVFVEEAGDIYMKIDASGIADVDGVCALNLKTGEIEVWAPYDETINGRILIGTYSVAFT